MKNAKRRLPALVLALLLALPALPVRAKADGTPDYGNGLMFYSDGHVNRKVDTGAERIDEREYAAYGFSWDGTTLTLENVSIKASGSPVTFSGVGNPTIVVKGEVTLENTVGGTSSTVIASAGNLTIRSEGSDATLYLKGGVYAMRPTNLTLEGDLTIYFNRKFEVGSTLNTTNGKIKYAKDGWKNLNSEEGWQDLPATLNKQGSGVYTIQPYSNDELMIITVGSASSGGGASDPGSGEPGEAVTGGSVTDVDPTIPEGEEGYVAPPSIDVRAFRAELTVYAVDVEWGAMTFRYIARTWDPETMTWKTDNPPGWQVYDHENNVPVTESSDINQITVSNRSNAPVKAAFAYGQYDGSGITNGTFSGVSPTALTDNAFTLLTANNNDGEGDGVGKETTGTVSFMPTTAPENLGSNKFTKIGTITVTVSPAAS